MIHPPFPVRLPVVDVSEVPADAREARIQAVLRDEVSAPFSLDRLPLVRWTLIRLGEQEHILLHVEHHMVHDGWSFFVFLREMVGLYQALSEGKPSPWPEPERQFADFACWQRSWMDGPVGQKQLEYWKRQLAGVPVELPLPYDRARPARQTFNGSSLRVMISEAEVSALASLAQTRGVTLYMTLLAAFQSLLARYTGQDDIVVGSGIANRRVPETESLMGMLLNNVVLRTDLSGDPSFEEVLDRVKQVTLGAYANQDVPFDRVVEAVNPPRRPDLSPLFHVLFSLYDGAVPGLEMPGLTLHLDEALGNGSAKFDLNVIAIARVRHSTGTPAGVDGSARHAPEPGRSILLVWEYNTDLFDAITMERMLGHFRKVISAVAKNPGQRLSELKLMTPVEESSLLAACCGKETPYPRESCIHEVFSRQAELTPDAVAIRFQGQEMTYRELDERANRLARYLRGRGVGPDIPVGICLERSVEMILGILGILKAGGAYVPLDPDYPRERVDFMLHDTGAALVVTRSALAERFSFPSGPYYLAGECGGGAVAYEMARQLRAGGEDVAFLGLLDTVFPDTASFVRLLFTRLRRRMDEGWQRVIHLPRGRRFRRTMAKLADIPRALGDELGWVKANPNPGNEQAKQKFIQRVSSTIYPQTLRRYKPGSYAGNVTLILSSEVHQSVPLWKAWLGCIRGRVDIKVVPADHLSYIRDHAGTTGRVFREALERAWQSR